MIHRTLRHLITGTFLLGLITAALLVLMPGTVRAQIGGCYGCETYNGYCAQPGTCESYSSPPNTVYLQCVCTNANDCTWEANGACGPEP